MDVVAILALIEKGITVAEVLIQAGKSAAPAFAAIRDLVTGAREGAVTQAEVDKTDALLDSLLAEFNQDI